MTNPAIRPILIGILVNFVLVLLKGVAGFAGNSFALVADAVESLSDILTSVIVYLGLKIALKEPDEDHPYGHGKAEPIATIFVSVGLILAGLLISVQSIRNILIPHALPAGYTLFILIGVVISKEILFRYVNKVGSEVESNAVKADAWHHRSDAISSAFAFLGISIALIGGKGFEIADDIAALLSALIIFYNAYKIFSPAFGEIMDIAPPKHIEERIREIASSIPDVKGLEKCFVRKMGLKYYVDLHVLVNGNLSVRDGHRIAHDVKDVIILHYPIIDNVLIHIEPYEESREE